MSETTEQAAAGADDTGLLARVPRVGVLAWSFIGAVIAIGMVVTALGVVSEIILPMTFLSTTFMVPELMPEWMATVAGYNPLTWAADASRLAMSASPDWPGVALRLVWLAAFAAVGLLLALRSFRSYRRSA